MKCALIRLVCHLVVFHVFGSMACEEGVSEDETRSAMMERTDL